MKTKYMILGLAMCGCIACVGLKARAADKAKASDPKEVEQIKSLDSLTAPGAAAVDSAKIAEIEALFKAKSANVRAHAAMALGSIGPAAKDSTPALAELLKDPDAIVRRTALRAIRKIHPGPKMMVPLCVKMIEAADPAMRARILNAIAEGGADAVPGLMEALKNEKAAFWALIVLRDIGPAAKDAVPAIAEKLKDKRPDIRREAVLTLGAMGNAAETAVPQLVELLNDKDAATAATFVLGKMGQIPKDAEATIRSNAKSNNEMLSTTSLWALTRVHPDDKELRRDTAEKLVGRLKDKDPFAQCRGAARALAALPPAPEIIGADLGKGTQGRRRNDDTPCHGRLGRNSAHTAVPRSDRRLEVREVPRRTSFIPSAAWDRPPLPRRRNWPSSSTTRTPAWPTKRSSPWATSAPGPRTPSQGSNQLLGAS